MLAKDGEKFDIDNIGRNPNPDEVEVIQFLYPFGERRRMFAVVGKEIAKKAKNLILSCRKLPNGAVALYARRIGEPKDLEEARIAENGPGNNEPAKVLIKLINEFRGGK